MCIEEQFVDNVIKSNFSFWCLFRVGKIEDPLIELSYENV